MSDTHAAERSRLLNKHRDAERTLQKELKKKKGPAKEAAQQQYDELLEKQKAELEEFDRGAAPAAGSGSGAKPAAATAAANPKAAARFPVLQWSDLSKKELEEESCKRGLGRKGNREDLITRLVVYSQEQERRLAKSGEAPADDDDEEESKPAARPLARPPPPTRKPRPGDKAADSDGDDDDEDDEDEESGDDLNMTEEQKIEAEKQYKREQMLVDSVARLLSDHPSGIPLDDLPSRLIAMGVLRDASMLEAPEKFGYKTLDELFNSQPAQRLRFDKATRTILPPRVAHK
eukprot:TRINITY_DN4052_c0_g1_i1.p1 TRINITY_DN4052_c0_g1~~TRINITY_DN4052_c0_g1_i1.p1  ORF type:complete len:302 (+),score=100.69 TRINITY_DN4052_c0_g1_i1:38-907(+)